MWSRIREAILIGVVYGLGAWALVSLFPFLVPDYVSGHLTAYLWSLSQTVAIVWFIAREDIDG